MPRLGGRCRSTDDGEPHGREQGIDGLIDQPLANGHMRFDTGDEYRQYRKAASFEPIGQLLQIGQALHHMLAHTEYGNEWLAFLISTVLLRPFQISIGILEQRTAARIPATHRRNDAHRCDIDLLTEGVAHDQLDHFCDVASVGLIPIQVHSKPGPKAGELLRNQRQHLRSDLDEFGVRVKRILVAPARDQTHQQLDRFRGLALLLLESMFTDAGQRHHLGHALVGKNGLRGRALEMPSEPIGL